MLPAAVNSAGILVGMWQIDKCGRRQVIYTPNLCACIGVSSPALGACVAMSRMQPGAKHQQAFTCAHLSGKVASQTLQAALLAFVQHAIVAFRLVLRSLSHHHCCKDA